MNGTLVLDASALLAVALHERGNDVVLSRIHSAENPIIHAANAFEVVYKLMIQCIPEDDAWRSVTYGNVGIAADMEGYIAKRSVQIKVGALFLSMADCYCLALGEATGGTVLTSDKGFTRAHTSANVVLFR